MSASPAVQLWVQLLLAASWQVIVLALLVWLGERRGWLRSPRARHALWWFVLVAPLALAPARLFLSQRDAMVRLPAPAAVMRVTEAVAAPPPLPESAPVAPLTPEPAPAPATPFSWRTAIFAGWLLGCALVALRLAVGHGRVRRMLHDSVPIEVGPARTLLDELCAQSGVRAALRQSATVGAATLCGVRRPTVIVPREWLTELSPTELRALLAHEVAHLRRRDLLAILAQRLVEIPLFFHPAVWAAGRFLAATREELCDAWAVAQGADPADYARCLTRLAARAQTRFAFASVGLVEGKSRLRQRVEAVLGARSRSTISRRAAIAMAAVLLLSVAGFAAVTLTASESPAPEPVQAAPAEPVQPAVVDFTVFGPDGKPTVANFTLDDGRDVYAQIERPQRGKITWNKGSISAGAGNMVLAGEAGKAAVTFPNPEPETRVLVFALHGEVWEAARVTLHLTPGSQTSRSITLEPLPPDVGRPGQAVVDFTVFLPDGKPAAGAAIVLEQSAQSARQPVHTDASGKARVPIENPTYQSVFQVTHPDPTHPGKLLEAMVQLPLDPGMHVSKIVALPAPESPLLRDLRGRVENLPWNGSAKSIQQARELITQADKKAGGADTIMWTHLGLRLYAGGRYPEALAAMRKVAERAGADPMELFTSWVWQGQLLDLMGRRTEALAAYHKALRYADDNTLQHDQWGMTIDRAWVEQRLQTPFRRPGTPAKAQDGGATVDFTVLLPDGKPAAGAAITIGLFAVPDTNIMSFSPLAEVIAGGNGKASWTGEVPDGGKSAETGLSVSYRDPKTGAEYFSRSRLLLQAGTHKSRTITLRPVAASAPTKPEQGRATLDLTVLFRSREPVPGAWIALEAHTTDLQLFQKTRQPGKLVRAEATGPRQWAIYMTLGKTGQRGKATVVIPSSGPGTRLLTITYHDPRTDKDLTGKRLLSLRPGTRTSATITIPSGTVQTIRSSAAAPEEATASARQHGAQAEEKAYWQRRRAEVAAMSPAERGTRIAEVQAQLRQIKAKQRPVDAKAAALESQMEPINARLHEIEVALGETTGEAARAGTLTPEARALITKLEKLNAERRPVTEQQEQLWDQRVAAERELSILQAASRG